MGKELLKVTLDEVQRAIDSYEGYCPDCNSFFCGPVEPDARGYKCPECHGDYFMGVEESLIAGYIYIIEG